MLNTHYGAGTSADRCFNLFKRWSWYVVVRFGWEEANQCNDPPRRNGDFAK